MIIIQLIILTICCLGCAEEKSYKIVALNERSKGYLEYIDEDVKDALWNLIRKEAVQVS